MPAMKVFTRCALTGALSIAALVELTSSAARSGAGPVFHKQAVAAAHPEASEAGASLLAAGGTAADAAAATMLALGVVSPTGSGLGGGGFALYYRARDKSLSFVDFRETAPAAATPALFAAREGDSASCSESPARALNSSGVAAAGAVSRKSTTLRLLSRAR